MLVRIFILGLVAALIFLVLYQAVSYWLAILIGDALANIVLELIP